MRHQRVLIGRHLAAELARGLRHLVAIHVLAQILLVHQPIAANRALHLRTLLAAVQALVMELQLRFALERHGANVADMRRNVHALNMRGHLPFVVETNSMGVVQERHELESMFISTYWPVGCAHLQFAAYVAAKRFARAHHVLHALMLQQLEVLHEIGAAHHAMERLPDARIVTVHVQLQGRLTDVRFLANRTVERIRIAVVLNVIEQHGALEELLAAAAQEPGLLVLQRIVIDGIAQHRERGVAQFALHRKVLADADVLLFNFLRRMFAPRLPLHGGRNDIARFIGGDGGGFCTFAGRLRFASAG